MNNNYNNSHNCKISKSRSSRKQILCIMREDVPPVSHKSRMYICMYMYTLASASIYVSVCLSIHLSIFLYLSMHPYCLYSTCICVCIPIYVCVYIYMCMCIRIYIYTHLCMHANTHVQSIKQNISLFILYVCIHKRYVPFSCIIFICVYLYKYIELTLALRSAHSNVYIYIYTYTYTYIYICIHIRALDPTCAVHLDLLSALVEEAERLLADRGAPSVPGLAMAGQESRNSKPTGFRYLVLREPGPQNKNVYVCTYIYIVLKASNSLITWYLDPLGK